MEWHRATHNCISIKALWIFRWNTFCRIHRNMLQTFFVKILVENCVSKFVDTVYPNKYAHGYCFAVLCCGYTLTDFPISIRLTSLALRQSHDCPSASKATLMNMDKYFMWIHYARLHNHNKAKHNKTVCIFLGIYCSCLALIVLPDWDIWTLITIWIGNYIHHKRWYEIKVVPLKFGNG